MAKESRNNSAQVDTAILFDGSCILCNTFAGLIQKKDKNKIFRFVSFQSVEGKNLIHKLGTCCRKLPESIIYLEETKPYYKSTAVLKIFLRMKTGYSLLYLLIIVPPFIRNILYDFIARNRYKWFGKKTACEYIPPVTGNV